MTNPTHNQRASSRTKEHAWIASAPKTSRCHRCDCKRVIEADGEMYFIRPNGTRTSEPPLCLPKAPPKASRSTAVRA